LAPIKLSKGYYWLSLELGEIIMAFKDEHNATYHSDDSGSENGGIAPPNSPVDAPINSALNSPLHLIENIVAGVGFGRSDLLIPSLNLDHAMVNESTSNSSSLTVATHSTDSQVPMALNQSSIPQNSDFNMKNVFTVAISGSSSAGKSTLALILSNIFKKDPRPGKNPSYFDIIDLQPY
jgi:ABC-type multidrug transport system fused ATPase/permease subunit